MENKILTLKQEENFSRNINETDHPLVYFN